MRKCAKSRAKPFIAYRVLVKLLLWLLAISGVSNRSAKDVLLYEEKYESFFSIQARMFWKLLLVFSTERSTSFSSKFGVVITLGTFTSIMLFPPADSFSTFSGRAEEVMVMLGGTWLAGRGRSSNSGELQISRLWSLHSATTTLTTIWSILILHTHLHLISDPVTLWHDMETNSQQNGPKFNMTTSTLFIYSTFTCFYHTKLRRNYNIRRRRHSFISQFFV